MKESVPLPTAQECEVVASAPSELQAVVVALRKLVLSAHPEATILVWPAHKIISFGYGPKKMTEHYAFIAVHPSHVNLGLYQGASLVAAGLALEGTGKALRHVKVRSAAEAVAPKMERLVQLARQKQAQLLKHAA